MLILPIDQSTSITGYAIIDANYNLITYGYWDKTKIGDTSEFGHTKKRNSLKQDIKNMLQEYPKICQVICEGVYKTNVKTHKKLSMVLGSIEDLCLELDMSCFAFENAQEWRGYIDTDLKGERKIVKKKTKEYVLSQYPKLPDSLTQDIYDAIAIGIAYLNMIYNKSI